MFSSLFGWLRSVWRIFMEMLGFGADSAVLPPPDAAPTMLSIFVRTNIGEKVHLELAPDWTVAQVKEQLSPQLGTASQHIKLIFAGKELPNNLVVGQCDLGQNSILHAVRIIATGPKKDLTATTSGDASPISVPASASGGISRTQQSPPAPPTPANTIAQPEQGCTESYVDGAALVAQTTEAPVCQSETRSSEAIVPEAVAGPSATSADDEAAPVDEASDCVLQVADDSQSCHSQRLLCDASTVMTIQLTELEQEQIKQLKEVSSGGERAHFYVYCVQPCGGVRTGKLRVRCARCKQGAVTLDTDPTCWADVLNDNTISCSCATPNCQSEVSCAEFYFKCGSHVTTGEDDVSVALYMIRVNLPGVLCLSCGDVASPVIVFECEASHVMCIDCFITYCLSKLSERQFTHDKELGYTLPCPVNCIDSLIREVHHFRMMGDDQYIRYQQWATEEAVLAAGGVLCPKAGCGHGLLPDEDCIRITCVGGCGYVFCRLCLQDYHTGECWKLGDAATSQNSTGASLSYTTGRADTGARWDVASAAAIHSLTKACPKCRTPTERSGGCMHMVCTRASCRYNWCWVCHTEWSRDCMASHWFG